MNNEDDTKQDNDKIVLPSINNNRNQCTLFI